MPSRKIFIATTRSFGDKYLSGKDVVLHRLTEESNLYNFWVRESLKHPFIRKNLRSNIVYHSDNPLDENKLLSDNISNYAEHEIIKHWIKDTSIYAEDGFSLEGVFLDPLRDQNEIRTNTHFRLFEDICDGINTLYPANKIDDHLQYIYQVRETNVFFYHHWLDKQFETKDYNNFRFLEAIALDVAKIAAGDDPEEYYFILHDSDVTLNEIGFARSFNNYKLPKKDQDALQNALIDAKNKKKGDFQCVISSLNRVWLYQHTGTSGLYARFICNPGFFANTGSLSSNDYLARFLQNFETDPDLLRLAVLVKECRKYIAAEGILLSAGKIREIESLMQHLNETNPDKFQFGMNKDELNMDFNRALDTLQDDIQRIIRDNQISFF